MAARPLFGAALAAGLCGCVTSDGPPPVIGYNVLYTQSDHMKRLVAASNFDEAVALHGREGAWFEANQAGSAALLDDVARGFNAQWAARIADATAACAAVAWPAPRERWAALREAVSSCTGIVRDYDASNGLTRGAREAEGMAGLRELASGLERRISADAAGLLAAEDLASGRNFLSEYPVALPSSAPFVARLRAMFDVARPDDARLFRVAEAYAPQVRADAAIRQAMVDAVSASLRAKAKTGSLRDVAATYRQAARSGVAPERIPVTAALYSTGAAATPFGATISPDLPLDWKVLSGLATVPDVDFVVALGPATLGVERKSADQARVQSRFVSGYRSSPNPAYSAAVADFTRAQQQMASANAQHMSAVTTLNCNMYGCQPNYWAQAIAAIFVGVASANLETAQKKLMATPPTVEEPILEDYGFDTASVTTTKKAEFVAYVGKPRTGATEQFRHASATSETFKVSHGVHDKDATLASTPFVPEKNVEDWEKRAVAVPLTALLEAAPDRRGYLAWPQVASTLDRRQQPGAPARGQAAQLR